MVEAAGGWAFLGSHSVGFGFLLLAWAEYCGVGGRRQEARWSCDDADIL